MDLADQVHGPPYRQASGLLVLSYYLPGTEVRTQAFWLPASSQLLLLFSPPWRVTNVSLSPAGSLEEAEKVLVLLILLREAPRGL